MPPQDPAKDRRIPQTQRSATRGRTFFLLVIAAMSAFGASQMASDAAVRVGPDKGSMLLTVSHICLVCGFIATALAPCLAVAWIRSLRRSRTGRNRR